MLSNGLIINGTYQIIHGLGENQEYEVYSGRCLKNQKDVLIRRLYEIKDINEADRQRICSLSHKSIAMIYDILWINDHIYVIEEYKTGISLNEYVRRNGKLSYKQIYSVLTQLVDAVSYLHQQVKMVVHANIRPENIIIDESSGTLSLTNMDVAKNLGCLKCQPVSQMAGNFLAPEQYLIIYEHMTVPVDAATDIYCMGCVLYYAITGYMPDARYDKIVPITSLHIYKEEGLLKVIEKMMSYQPEDRYQDAMQLGAAVKECYKLDKRYRRIKRKRLGHIILTIFLFVGGAVSLLGGIYRNKIDDIQVYQDKLKVIDQYAAEQLYYDAADAVKDMQSEYPDCIELFQREVEYMFLSGDYEDCIDRAKTIDRDYFSKRDEEEEIEEEDLRYFGDFYHAYAQSSYYVGEYEEAQDIIETALEYYSQDYSYYRDYALILIAQGKVDKAEGQLKISDELEWNELEYTFIEARIADAKEEYDEAIEKYIKVVNESSDMKMKRDIYTYCAQIYNNKRDYRNEISILEQAKQVFPEEEEYDLQMARAYMAWGEEETYSSSEYYTKAKMLYEKLVKNNPDDFEIKGNIAVLYGKLGDEATEEEQLLVLKEEFRDKYQIYMWLCMVEDHKQENKKKKKRNYEQMKKYYEKARKLYSSSTKDYDMEDLEERMTELKEEGWIN